MTAVRRNVRTLYSFLNGCFADCRLARLSVALLCTASLSDAAVLPDGTGKAETVKLCGRCHSLDQAVSLRQEQAAWAETLSKMVNLGAQGSEDDLNTILNYLVKFYGPVGGPAGAGAGAAPGARPANITPAVGASSSTVESASRPARALNAKVGNLPAEGSNIDPAKEWRTYGHDAGGMRFSPLKQIKPDNVGQLKVAWVYHMRPPGFTGTSGPRPVATRGRAQVGPSAMNRNLRLEGAAGSNSARVSVRAKSHRS